MSYNPDDPDFEYLAIDKRKLIAEAAGLEGKKMCLIPDEKEGYVSAEIKSTKGDDVVVMNESSQVRTPGPR